MEIFNCHDTEVASIISFRSVDVHLNFFWKLRLLSISSGCKNIPNIGHVIDDEGIHTESDKLQHIQKWRTPHNYNEVQKFLRLVQYLAQFMPDITVYTTPLSGLAHNNQAFQWTPLLEKASRHLLQELLY